jgi:O-methyltransferase
LQKNTRSYAVYRSICRQSSRSREKAIAREVLADRAQATSGDFFKDPLPKADVITMGMILHDWNLEKKKQLIKSAYAALPKGGAFIAVENLIDDARRENAFGLLMSLNMLIEFGDAFDFSGVDFWQWCKEAGFDHYEVLYLAEQFKQLSFS